MERRIERTSALILAGGLSRRMGRDKAWLELGGLPLVERLALRVLPLADEFIFSTNQPAKFRELLLRLPAPAHLVVDEAFGLGPLAGIAAGLSAARCDLVLVLAVDLPFVNLDLLSFMASLAAGFEAVVPEVPHPASTELLAQPLHAFYRRSCLPAVRAHLDAGHRRAIAFLPDVRTRWVLPGEISGFDPEFISFRNLNTPADWALAEQHLTPPNPP